MAEEKDIAFEEAMNSLENIVASLEKGDVPLDKSLELFEEGVALVKLCTKKLEAAEKKVRILTGNPDEDFSDDANQNT